MKRLVLGLIIMSIGLYAWSINGKDMEGDTIIYYLECEDGSLPTISKNTTINKFFPGNTYSMEKAANIVCTKHKTTKHIITIKKECLVFTKRVGDNGIESALMSPFAYQVMKALFSMGNKDGFLLGKKSSSLKLKYYSPHKVTVDKHGNYINSKNTGQYTKMLIDGYYKVKDNTGSIFYVRKNCTTE